MAGAFDIFDVSRTGHTDPADNPVAVDDWQASTPDQKPRPIG